MADQPILPQWAIDKFWRDANPRPGDECWIWSGSLHGTTKYAIIFQPRPLRVKGRAHYMQASHASLIIDGHPRPAPPRHFALHGDCSDGRCVNPRHLRWGTNTENTADRVRLGRHNAPSGVRHSGTKLTLADIEAILVDSRSQAEIARAFGACQASISNIKARKSFQKDIALIEKGKNGGDF